MEPAPTLTPDVRNAIVDSLAAQGFRDAVQIGQSGRGLVYRCTQVALDRVVAVKCLTIDIDGNRPRFEREQLAMATLAGHPHIIAVLQIGATGDGRPFLVMPYHPRSCLQTRIRTLGQITVEETLQVGVRIAGALDAAHGLQIVHGDVKPGNILTTDHGEPALADFGIAVLRGEVPSPASDVYGLGATLFAALAGGVPPGRNEPAPRLRDRGVAEDVAAVVFDAMNPDPRARPSAAEFGRQLRGVQAGRGLSVAGASVDGEDRPAVPPPRSAGRTHAPSPLGRNRGNLPAAVDGFVGRGGESAALTEQLSSSRLVTVTGVGGVGKSALALQAAREREPHFPDGVWLVDVGEMREGSMLAGVAAATLRIVDQSARPVTETMLEALADRATLLLLDNCERAVDDTAEFVQTLLEGCPRLRVLATSRELLGVGGESVLPLAPLPCPPTHQLTSVAALSEYDAVALFVERARTAKPAFSLTQRNASAVAKICAQLDGLPLAIELAAARLSAMSVDQIAERLSDRFRLLTRGRRGAPTRQQTLSWCIDWSFDRCTPTEQRLWKQLSVFDGSFELKAAHDVCEQGVSRDDLLDDLCALVDKSVLIRTDDEDAVRFQLLGILREYGKSRLDTADDYAALQRRHLDWYRRLAHQAGNEWFGAEQVAWIRRLRPEMPNIQEALQFGLTDSPTMVLAMTADMRQAWTATGMLQEGRRWLERALAATPAEPSPVRVRAVVSVMMLAVLQTDWPTVSARTAEARELLAAAPDPVSKGLVAFADGFAAMSRGEFDRAQSRAEEGLATTDDFEVQTLCLLVLAWRQFGAGDAVPAVQNAEKALALAEARGDAVTRVRMLGAVTVSRFVLGDIGIAGAALRTGLQLCMTIGHSWAGARYLELLAWIAGADGDQRRAVLLMAASAAEGRAGGATATTMAFAPKFHEACERRVRDELSAEEFDDTWAEGSSWSFDQAAAYALEL